MYKLYASKSNNPDDSAMFPNEYEKRQEVAKRCIDLFNLGYTLHKIVLPDGVIVTGDRINMALSLGEHSLRAAIKEVSEPSAR